jgi:hypothetical protein
MVGIQYTLRHKTDTSTSCASSLSEMPTCMLSVVDAMAVHRGLLHLKEAFDITFAVHRMEEEGARRRAYKGRGGAGRADEQNSIPLHLASRTN